MIEHLACEKDVVWCIDSYFNREPTHLMMDAVENSVLWEIPRDIMEEYGNKKEEPTLNKVTFVNGVQIKNKSGKH